MGWQISQSEVEAFLAARPQACHCLKRQATFVVYASTGWGGHMLDVCAWCLLVDSGVVGDIGSVWSPDVEWETPAVEREVEYMRAFREAAEVERPVETLPDQEQAERVWKELVTSLRPGSRDADVSDVHAWALWMLTPDLKPKEAKRLVQLDWDSSGSWYTLKVHDWIRYGLPQVPFPPSRHPGIV